MTEKQSEALEGSSSESESEVEIQWCQPEPEVDEGHVSEVSGDGDVMDAEEESEAIEDEDIHSDTSATEDEGMMQPTRAEADVEKEEEPSEQEHQKEEPVDRPGVEEAMGSVEQEEDRVQEGETVGDREPERRTSRRKAGQLEWLGYETKGGPTREMEKKRKGIGDKPKKVEGRKRGRTPKRKDDASQVVQLQMLGQMNEMLRTVMRSGVT